MIEKNVQVGTARVSEKLPENTYVPLVDIYETPEGTTVVAEMPGVSKDDVRVEVDKGVLTIGGRTTWSEPGEQYARTYVGFGPGEFYRTFALSDEVDRDRISANMNNGVLTLTLPKAEAARPKKIHVTAE